MRSGDEAHAVQFAGHVERHAHFEWRGDGSDGGGLNQCVRPGYHDPRCPTLAQCSTVYVDPAGANATQTRSIPIGND